MTATLFVLLLFVGLFSAFEDSFLDEEFLADPDLDAQREYVKMLETDDQEFQEEFLALMEKEAMDQDEEDLAWGMDTIKDKIHGALVKDKGVCWKNTNGRGVGKIPSECPHNYRRHGLLCYRNCPSGYRTVTGHVDPYCYRTCASGYRDHGLTCYKHFFKWYWKTDKIGRIKGMSCGGGMEYDAGLCYRRCPSNTHGVGPVCWGKCTGDKPVNGGAICCKDHRTCGTKIIKLTTSTLKVVMKAASGNWAGAAVNALKASLGYIMPICGN